MKLVDRNGCRVVIRDAAPQEFTIDGIRRIGEQGDVIRDVLMYQISGLEHSGTVRIDRQNDDVRMLQLVRRNQKSAHSAQ